MQTIYKTVGAAAEYCELALDIYENCPHQCSYCYAKKKKEKHDGSFTFGGPRKNIVEETRAYLESHKELSGRMIFLGFSSDPFPVGEDTRTTVEIAKLLKSYGCLVMACTKGKLTDDVKEALNYIDSVGITLSCGQDMASKYEGHAATVDERIELLKYAKSIGKETWISFEPVLDEYFVYDTLNSSLMKYVDVVKVGKLNHMTLAELTGNADAEICWGAFAHNVSVICELHNIKYIIKQSLLKMTSDLK